MHAIAIEAALAGAKAIREIAAGDLAAQGKSGVEDFVTTADVASEQAIIRILKKYRPQDKIVAEETGSHAGSSAIQWYVDPLDGTANILAGSPDYAVSIAAQHGDQVVAAAIYRPSDGKWLATSPSSRVVGPIAPGIASVRPLSQAKVTVSRPHDPVRRHEAMTLRAALLPHVADEQRVGSAACALLRVVTGQLDAYISVDLPHWDTAAGHCLVERVGGVVIRACSRIGTPLCIAGPRNTAVDLADLLAK